MKSALKILLSMATIVVCVFSARVFGFGLWSAVFLGLSTLILLSLMVRAFDEPAIIIARIIGVLSTLAGLLLMLAGTVGGSFHLSESNEWLLLGWIMMALFGLMFFFVRLPKR